MYWDVTGCSMKIAILGHTPFPYALHGIFVYFFIDGGKSLVHAYSIFWQTQRVNQGKLWTRSRSNLQSPSNYIILYVWEHLGTHCQQLWGGTRYRWCCPLLRRRIGVQEDVKVIDYKLYTYLYMYICMYVYIHIYILYIYKCQYIYIHIYICTCVCSMHVYASIMDDRSNWA